MSLEKKLMMKSLGSRLPPMPPSGIPTQRNRGPGGRRKDYSQLPWSDYFDSFEDINIDDDIFRIYRCGSEGPVLFLLHGGGFSSLTWAVFAKSVIKLAGCQVVAMDVRGHGDTRTKDEENLSEEKLTSDIGNVIAKLYDDPEEAPPIILIGHSMGGAVAVHAAKRDVIPSLMGLVVLDVVEGSALDALQSMQSFLRGRPQKFKSLEFAIEWVTKSSQIRNLESARVSMIGQLKKIEVESEDSLESRISDADAIIEEEEGEDSHNSSSDSTNQKQNSSGPAEPSYTWRIDLSKTEKYWQGWFKGMSELFLSCAVPKVLMLAGVDRLDKALSVGQMQGKFQMVVISNCGHALHEDQPHKVAEAIAAFLIRNRFAEPLGSFKRPFPSC